MNSDPHRDRPVREFGRPIRAASGAVILLHGRGGSAEDILPLATDPYLPQLVYLAPQAAGNSWYPNSFLAPRGQNEPWLTSALGKVETTVQMAIDAGISADRIVIAGFSQGACLATEFVASRPQRYAGLIAFSGGLIGSPGADLAHEGDLAGSGGDIPALCKPPTCDFQRRTRLGQKFNSRCIRHARQPSGSSGHPHVANLSFERRSADE
jgi:phospholipase/carboxylesterase